VTTRHAIGSEMAHLQASHAVFCFLGGGGSWPAREFGSHDGVGKARPGTKRMSGCMVEGRIWTHLVVTELEL